MKWSLLALLVLGCPSKRVAQGDRPGELDGGPAPFPTLADHEPATAFHALAEDFAPDAGAALEAELAATARRLSARVQRVSAADPDEVALQLTRLVAQNLEAKRAAGFPLAAAQLSRQVIAFEAFRFETYVATGVFPKRYFGYLDERWDTAEYEVRLKAVARRAARACNRWLEADGADFRVTEQELIVTFLAEGGAVLLRERQAELEAIHPVLGIGLDDIASGFMELRPLVTLMDRECGTALEGVVAWRGGQPLLSRFFRFEEALAGTAVMWVWEKRIAQRKLAAQHRAGLAQRPWEEQFVIASLVYNSGLLFDEKLVARVRALDTGGYLFQVSERSKARHWALPVGTPQASLQRLLDGLDYPEQGTTWSTVFHVLQRYGAFVALTRFGDSFDADGRLTGAVR